MTAQGPRTLAWMGAAAAALVAAPYLLPPYQLRLVTEGIVFSLFAVSYNLLLGYGGLLSFGHAMFFGVGAFATAICLNALPGVSCLVAAGLGTLAALLAGLVVGSLLLRVKGTPFALLTLAFNALFFAIGVKWHTLTGGDDGLNVVPPKLNLGLAVLDPGKGPDMYYLTLIVLGAALFFCWRFTATAMGHSVLLLRENEERMRFLGYNTNVTRLVLFVFVGGLAGLAGSFYTLLNAFVSLDAISIDNTTKVLLMTFLGGTGSFSGPILGAFFYTYVQDYLSNLTDNWQLIMGVLFIGMVLFAPGGLSGLGQGIASRLGRSKKASQP